MFFYILGEQYLLNRVTPVLFNSFNVQPLFKCYTTVYKFYKSEESRHLFIYHTAVGIFYNSFKVLQPFRSYITV